MARAASHLTVNPGMAVLTKSACAPMLLQNCYLVACRRGELRRSNAAYEDLLADKTDGFELGAGQERAAAAAGIGTTSRASAAGFNGGSTPDVAGASVSAPPTHVVHGHVHVVAAPAGSAAG